MRPSIHQRPLSSSAIALPWIIRMRFGIAAGQVAVALVAHFVLGLRLPLHWIFPVPLLTVASNLYLTSHARRQDAHAEGFIARLVGWVFCLDALSLTALLMLAGGPSNPFTVLYLVHITLAAAILSARQTWTLSALSVACFASLFWVSRPIPQLGLHHAGQFHFQGMWITFVIAVLLVATFAARIASLLREHDEARLRMHDELAKNDRLASLVTLAAGAAHELSTPLATIAENRLPTQTRRS